MTRELSTCDESHFATVFGAFVWHKDRGENEGSRKNDFVPNLNKHHSHHNKTLNSRVSINMIPQQSISPKSPWAQMAFIWPLISMNLHMSDQITMPMRKKSTLVTRKSCLSVFVSFP